MRRGPKVAVAALVAGLACIGYVGLYPRAEFLLGGAMVNAGLRLQDQLHAYDFEHEHDITPGQVWAEFERQNEAAAAVRSRFPRSSEHPVIAMLVCMDARIDTSELAGDTRRYYYIIRTAGSVLDEEEQEMLELAVRNGVKVLVLTRHTDCAAEKVAADPEMRKGFPALSASVDARDRQLASFLARPFIADRIAKGELLVKDVLIDTRSDHLIGGTREGATATGPRHL
jgi:hypothetical protein